MSARDPAGGPVTSPLRVGVIGAGVMGDRHAPIRELAGERRLDGVECYYAEHTPEQTARFVGLCRELGLVTTGGSDFHGPAVRAATLGQPPVPWAAFEELRRRAGR